MLNYLFFRCYYYLKMINFYFFIIILYNLTQVQISFFIIVIELDCLYLKPILIFLLTFLVISLINH
jgi:hypothetical protein